MPFNLTYALPNKYPNHLFIRKLNRLFHLPETSSRLQKERPKGSGCIFLTFKSLF
jgi:hypothetical protein